MRQAGGGGFTTSSRACTAAERSPNRVCLAAGDSLFRSEQPVASVKRKFSAFVLPANSVPHASIGRPCAVREQMIVSMTSRCQIRNADASGCAASLSEFVGDQRPAPCRKQTNPLHPFENPFAFRFFRRHRDTEPVTRPARTNAARCARSQQRHQSPAAAAVDAERPFLEVLRSCPPSSASWKAGEPNCRSMLAFLLSPALLSAVVFHRAFGSATAAATDFRIL